MNLEKLKKLDYIITLVIAVLLFIGTTTIYAATYNTLENDLIYKQVILIIVGTIVYLGISIIDIEWLKVVSIQLMLYGVIIAVLLYVNLFGSAIAGTNRWIDFGFFSFQPSEYAKITIILFISLVFSNSFLPIREKLEEVPTRRFSKSRMGWSFAKYIKAIKDNRELRLIFVSGMYMIPVAFLTFIQPSLGNTIIIMILTSLCIFLSMNSRKLATTYLLIFLSIVWILRDLIMLDLQSGSVKFALNHLNGVKVIIFILASILINIVGRVKVSNILISLGISMFLLGGLYLSWNGMLGNYQRERILTFIEGPEADPLGSGYQVIQSKIAIGSGRLFGRGFLEGSQSSLHILTQAHTDFAFAVVSEQYGFVGAVLLLLIYAFLIFRIIKVSKETKDDFGRNLCLGAASLFLIHIFINIGMNLGKLPVTGIPLPLISYGGSSIIMNMILLGLVQAVYASRRSVDMADSLMLTSLKSS